MKTLHAKGFLLAAVISISFLVAIPSTQALPEDLTLKVTATHQGSADPYTFDITIDADLVNKVLEASSLESLTEALDEIRATTLTEEQKLELLRATSIKISEEKCPDCYVEIEDIFWTSEFPWLGALVQIHLCDIHAFNVGAAIGFITLALDVIVWLVLSPTLIGNILAAIITLELALLNIDYWGIYTQDMNADKSFDIWTVIRGQTYWFVCNLWMQVYTPHYRWRITLAGAFIDGRQRPPQPSDFHRTPRYNGNNYGGAYRHAELL